jgi:hypothetical protein
MSDVMEMVDRYHRLFGVPVFVLPPSALSDVERREEFVIALNAGGVPHSCFQYNLDTEGDTAQLVLKDAIERRDRFLRFLSHPELKTVEAFLK